MKKLIIILLTAIVLLASFLFIHQTQSPVFKNESNNDKKQENIDIQTIDKTTVSYNSWLHTNGAKLENSKGEQIQLRGISSHGIEWFSDLITYDNLTTLKNDWHINTFRIAMYSKSYIKDPSLYYDKVTNIVDMAIDLDMYVIVDWHILEDKNPQTYKEEAKQFFSQISQKYKNTPNIIYEICNEPNGSNVTWDGQIKPYAEEIIPIIRDNAPNSLIIVGTPNWCKQLDQAANNPLSFNNIVYACHFYSGSHKEELRNKINYCLQRDIPIFVSECGLTDATGNGNVYFDEFNTWINYLNNNNISWIYWSFSNKDESSAVLKSDYTVKKITEYNEDQNIPYNEISVETNQNNTEIKEINNDSNGQENISDNNEVLNINDYLTKSGDFIKGIFQSY